MQTYRTRIAPRVVLGPVRSRRAALLAAGLCPGEGPASPQAASVCDWGRVLASLYRARDKKAASRQHRREAAATLEECLSRPFALTDRAHSMIPRQGADGCCALDHDEQLQALTGVRHIPQTLAPPVGRSLD